MQGILTEPLVPLLVVSVMTTIFGNSGAATTARTAATGRAPMQGIVRPCLG